MKIFDNKLTHIKILEFKEYQGNLCKIQSHKLHKGEWKINPKFEFHKLLIANNSIRFLWHKEYSKEIKNE